MAKDKPFVSKYLGRPQEYKEEYCDQLIEHMASGLSFESFASAIGMHRATLYRWVNEYQAFCDAKQIGTDKNLHWWEKQGLDGLWEEKDSISEKGMPYASRTINNTMWVFNMKNRHKWRDKPLEDEEPAFTPEGKKVSKKSDDELDTILEDSEE